ncbi:MAG: hypothetical protein LKG19_00950 [Saprospiraceae bacterium]|nr:hypothetical protein [Saprospiraceae bacterium]
MKKLTLLVTIACGIILFSCNSNTGQKSSENQASAMTDHSSVIQDSIKKAEEFEYQQTRQDSIDATQIKGYSIKKLSGKHKYGGVTKIEYQSLAQLIDEAKKQSEKEMWPKEKLQSTIDVYKSGWKGGLVRLYIERTTIGSANTEMFSIIMKDTNENELFRVELDSDIPEYSSDNWWNYGYAYIDKRIKVPFYVYVVDRLEDAPFKFEVTSIKK